MPEVPFAVKWEIPENRLLPLKDLVNGHLESASVSNIHGFHYRLRIYPNGDNDARRGQTWIYLELDLGKLNKVQANYTFTVKSANYSKHCRSIYEKSGGWGGVICSAKDFFDPQKKFIADGKLTVKCDGIFEVKAEFDFLKQIQNWDGGVLGDKLWWNNDSKDITIVADGMSREISRFLRAAHKNTLASTSQFFYETLCLKKQEIIENKSNYESNEVKIPNFSFKIVETAVKLLYECNFVTYLTLEELMSLLRFFNEYGFPGLKEKVESVLIKKISAANVCRLTNCSILTESLKLKEKCVEFLMVAFASKTPLSNANELDIGVIITVLQNSLYSVV
uniref:BTB domain-containing protein n=1 Tax=Panagrolaimus davidi TaxID=227884 RepID=A0A914QZM4_9BILA